MSDKLRELEQQMIQEMLEYKDRFTWQDAEINARRDGLEEGKVNYRDHLLALRSEKQVEKRRAQFKLIKGGKQ